MIYKSLRGFGLRRVGEIILKSSEDGEVEGLGCTGWTVYNVRVGFSVIIFRYCPKHAYSTMHTPKMAFCSWRPPHCFCQRQDPMPSGPNPRTHNKAPRTRNVLAILPTLEILMTKPKTIKPKPQTSTEKKPYHLPFQGRMQRNPHREQIKGRCSRVQVNPRTPSDIAGSATSWQ